MPLDRSHLELLGALDEHTTLRAAATIINLSPSAASRRLADAERRVGVALTEVDGRSLRLTSAGRHLANAARDANRLLADAEIAARWLDRGTARPVTIGLSFYDSVAWAIGADAPVEILRTTDRGWPGALADGTLDVVIDVGDSAAAPSKRALADDHLVAVVPSDHDLARAGLPIDAQDFVRPTYFASTLEIRPGFEYEVLFRPSDTAPDNIVRIESAACVLDLIALGRGVSIQPRLAVTHRNDVVVLELARRIDVQWWAHLGSEADDRVELVVDEIAGRFAAAITDTDR